MPEFLPTFWNTKTQHNGSSRTSKVSGGQVAYKKKGYAWANLNTDIQNDFSVTSFPGNVQIPVNAQDWMDLNFNGQYSAKRQILEGNWSHSEDAFEMRMRTDCPTNSVGIIHPDKPWQVIYYNAFGQGANLIYGIWHGRATRVEHVIEITEMPPGDSEYLTYDFYIQSNDATTFVGANLDQRPWDGNTGDAATVEGFNVFLAKGDDPATVRGSVLRTPVCWWANLDGTTTKKNVRIDFEIQPDGITVKATKYVKRSDVIEALSQGVPYRADATFYPDPSPETSSVDGFVMRNVGAGETWANMRGGTGTYLEDNSSSTTCVNVQCDSNTDEFDQIRRAFYFFDTSSIGAGQQADSATFTAYHSSPRAYTSYELTIGICGSNSSNTTSLSNSDFESAQFTSFSSDGVAMSSLTYEVGYDFDLNATGLAAIDVEGMTRICMGDKTYDFANSPPTWGSGHSAASGWYFSEQTGSSFDPVIVITHSAAGPAMSILSNHYNQMRNR